MPVSRLAIVGTGSLRIGRQPEADFRGLRMIWLQLQNPAVMSSGQVWAVQFPRINAGQREMSPGFARVLLKHSLVLAGGIHEVAGSLQSQGKVVSAISGCRIYGQGRFVGGQRDGQVLEIERRQTQVVIGFKIARISRDRLSVVENRLR